MRLRFGIRAYGLMVALSLLAVAATAADAVKFPPNAGRVTDAAHVLSPQTIESLAEKLQAHETATGEQVVVATVPSLQGLSIEDYGYQLGRAWGVGQKDKDTGLILLVAPHERKMRIEVGYGLEGAMPDATAKEIIDGVIVPRFKQGDLPGGIVAGTDAILRALGDPKATNALPVAGHSVPMASFDGSSLFDLFLIVLALFFGVPLFWLFFLAGGWRGGIVSFGGGGFGGGFMDNVFSGGGGSFGGGGASSSW